MTTPHSGYPGPSPLGSAWMPAAPANTFGPQGGQPWAGPPASGGWGGWNPAWCTHPAFYAAWPPPFGPYFTPSNAAPALAFGGSWTAPAAGWNYPAYAFAAPPFAGWNGPPWPGAGGAPVGWNVAPWWTAPGRPVNAPTCGVTRAAA